jgi:hypothetical protein
VSFPLWIKWCKAVSAFTLFYLKNATAGEFFTSVFLSLPTRKHGLLLNFIICARLAQDFFN